MKHALALLLLFAFLEPITASETGHQARTKARETAPAIKQTPVDFNHPPREYVASQAHGWSILVEKQLVDEASELADKALARLKSNLDKMAGLFPKSALPDLRRVKVFLMYGPRATAGGRGNGLEYFQRTAPKHYDWLDPRMGSSIAVFCAENYTQLSDSWALKSLVHEFAHAQHLEHWPEARADIYDTWERAVKAGLYQTVRPEDKDVFNPNYAARNHLEYFAELSAMYFVGVEYFPRDRAGLKAYDPAGYALIEKLWGIGEEP